MNIFGDVPSVVVAGFIITIAAFIVHLIGFATPYWIKIGSIHAGLWTMCDKTCIFIRIGIWADKFKAVRAFKCLAFIAHLAAVVLVNLKIFVRKDQKILYIGTAVACLIAGGFALTGCIIYSTFEGFTSVLHFSFAFCIIAAIGATLAGALFIQGWRSG